MNRKLDEQWQATADALARYGGGPRAQTAAWVFGGIAALFVLLAVASLALWIDMMRGGTSASEIGMSGSKAMYLVLICSGLSLLMMLLAGYSWNELLRMRRCREALSSAVRAQSGYLIDGRQVAGWLVEHWRGEYPMHRLVATSDIIRAVLQLEGFPVLIDVAPYGLMQGSGTATGYYPWWGQVMVAADLPPGSAAWLAPDNPGMQGICARGYGSKFEVGGLVASALETTEKKFKKRPESVAELVAVAIDLARITAMAGGRPVQAPR